MATDTIMPPPSSTHPRLLPHQLVPRDDRSSYIKRVETLAGPGAYVIPSTFKTMEMNAQAHEIHKEQFGREFARQQRHLSMGESTPDPKDTDGDAPLSPQVRCDQYLARRERLRELLEQQDQRRDHRDYGDSSSTSLSPVNPFTSTETFPQSPSLSSTSNYDAFVEGYRRRSSSASARSPTSPLAGEFESMGFASPRRQAQRGGANHATSQATSPVLTRLTYREYLATTSYRKRLAKKHYDTTKRPSLRTELS